MMTHINNIILSLLIVWFICGFEAYLLMKLRTTYFDDKQFTDTDRVLMPYIYTIFGVFSLISAIAFIRSKRNIK